MIKEPLTSIVMAVRNELKNIEPTVKAINSFKGNFELIFVEGHSDDGTLEEIKRISSLKWKYPIRFVVQDGIGKKNALLKGFEMAKGNILLMYDLDGEIPSSAIMTFYDELKKDENIFVCGNRFVKGRVKSMHPLNWTGNLLFAFVSSIITGHKFRDVLLGIKGLWKKNYKKMKSTGTFSNNYDRFGELDLVFGSSYIGLNIKQIPTQYLHRHYGSSKVNPYKTGWLLIIRCLLEIKRKIIRKEIKDSK